MTPIELDQFAAVMVRRKLIRIDIEGVKLELSPQAFEQPATEAAAEAVRYPTDEEFLYMSSPLGPPEPSGEAEEEPS